MSAMLVASADFVGRRGVSGMATWDARDWLADMMAVAREDLTVRSIDRYGETETQVRYEQGGAAVARLTVTGPLREMLQKDGEGRWEIKAQIGAGTAEVHRLELPETDEIVY
jgi:hypothetical protein